MVCRDKTAEAYEQELMTWAQRNNWEVERRSWEDEIFVQLFCPQLLRKKSKVRKQADEEHYRLEKRSC